MTLTNCGTSSIFVFIKKRPRFVIKAWITKWLARDSVFLFIAQNQSNKIKWLLIFPIRTWSKIGEPVSTKPKIKTRKKWIIKVIEQKIQQFLLGLLFVFILQYSCKELLNDSFTLWARAAKWMMVLMPLKIWWSKSEWLNS